MESAGISRAASKAMAWALMRSEASATVTGAFQMVSGVLMLTQGGAVAAWETLYRQAIPVTEGESASRPPIQLADGGSVAEGRASRRRLASASVMGMGPWIMPFAISSMG